MALQDRLPPEIDRNVTVYELRPQGMTPNTDVLATSDALTNFTRTWRGLLAHLEAHHPGLPAIDVFPAVPVTAAVAIGRAPMRDVHPPLRVYDRNPDGGYDFTLEVTQ